ncbi:MAG: hypothetical protein EPN53_10865, partial [Acidobacteria bacterium]
MIAVTAFTSMAGVAGAAPEPPAPAPAAAFTVILGGAQAGTMTVRVTCAAAYRIHFEYNDRGRGPRLDSTIRL